MGEPAERLFAVDRSAAVFRRLQRMNEVTPKGFILPDILGDEDLWGQDTNANWELLDQLITSLQGDLGLRVLRSGDAMSGILTLGGDPISPLDAVTKRYADGLPFLPLAGGVLSGSLTLAVDPLGPLDAVTKRYADSLTPAGGPFLPLSGSIAMTGPLTLSAAPITAALQAASKAYVDAVVTSIYNLRGGWNANTNSPALSNGGGGGVKGDVYTVTTAGSTSLDGVSTWAVGDQVQNAGAAWVRVAYSTAFGSMAFQQATAVAITGGTLAGVTSLGFSDSSIIAAGTPIMPDLVWWRRDVSGNIVQGLDFAGTSLFQNAQVYGTATLGNMTAAVATITGETVGTLTFQVGDVAQAGSSLVPDLARWVRGDNGQFLLGFGADGSVVMKDATMTGNVTIQGTLTAPGTGVATVPVDALDITKYGGVGDGADDVFLGIWTAGANALTLTKYSGTVSWSGNTLTLSGLASTNGPGFDPFVVGMSVRIGATDASGVNQTVTITGWTSQSTVTVSATPTGAVATAQVTWPAFTAADIGKGIRVEAGAASINRQAYDNNLVPWCGKIASVVDGHSVTVTGPIVPNFTSTNNGRPTRVSWGTDNHDAYVQCGNALLTSGSKVIYHPRAAGRGRTVYYATGLAQRGNNDIYFVLISTAATLGYLHGIWVGDPTVVGVLSDASGRLLPKRLVPSRAPPPSPPTRDLIAKLHLPRTMANAACAVVEVGDSLTKYDPTGQSDAWFPANIFERKLITQNPKKTFSFSNIANVGVGWAEMVDPSSGLSWLVPGTDFFYMTSSGNNDFWRMHPIKVMIGLNIARANGNDSGGRPADIMLATAALQGERADTNAGGACAYVHEGHLFGEVLLRSMAKAQGIGLVDLSWQSEQIMHGASNYHRELQQLPDFKGYALAPATPFTVAMHCYAWSMQITMNATGVWASAGQVIVSLSPMPGNVFIIDADTSVNRVRYEGRLWGRAVTTTVSTSGGTLTTTPGTALPAGTLTWPMGNNQLTFAGGGFTGRAGQCILLPGLDVSGQNQRTYLNQVISDTTAVVDDFWLGAPPGSGLNTFSGTVTPTVGGQQFIADDARAQVDVVMTWGTSSYRGKITGFTDANTVTLTPAPPALTGQVVQMWIGRISVPQTTSTIASTGNTFNLYLSLNEDVLSVRDSLTHKIFRGTVERWGNRYCPTISVTGSGITADFINLYGDRDVYYTPMGSIMDIHGNADQNFSGGGGGGHDPSILAERLVRRAYEALDFCAM
jgi:hypothetical protein